MRRALVRGTIGEAEIFGTGHTPRGGQRRRPPSISPAALLGFVRVVLTRCVIAQCAGNSAHVGAIGRVQKDDCRNCRDGWVFDPGGCLASTPERR